VHGDAWSSARGGPLASPGVRVAVGDLLLAINHTPLSPHSPPAAALQFLGGQEVMLTVRSALTLEKALAKLSLAEADAARRGTGKGKGRGRSSAKGKDGKGGGGGGPAYEF
jgi:hypothetical protein